ncbi:CBU_0592 family membrane protein [Ketogulonicigenium vulgare]|nr:cyclic nucleotide-binding protein [Ketogulonicigenium vulgare]
MPDFIGLLGAVFYLSAYAMLQLGKLKLEDNAYAGLNILGAIAILTSLIWSFNLGALVTQSAWLVFTVLGVIRSRMRRAALPPNPAGHA